MEILRIEDDLGYGPYQSKRFGEYADDLMDIDRSTAYSPSPFADGMADALEDLRMIYDLRDIRFGFTSRAQLERWFTRYHRGILQAHGFKVARYKVASRYTVRGGHQVAFVRSRAERLGQERLIPAPILSPNAPSAGMVPAQLV